LTEPQPAHETSDELLGRVAHELSLLVRADLELAAAERAPQVRRISIELATALAAAVALVLALAAASLAAIQGLDTVLPSWAASLIVAGAWALVGLLLLRLDHPRRLLRRLSSDSTDRGIESARAARSEAERAVKTSAEKLAEAMAREADALAMGTCARNVVLVGDPQQLAQVLQGSHPQGTDASVLTHLLGDADTIPPDRGVFLERTFRLHPDICGYISEEFYEGRLHPDPVTSKRTTPFGTGLRYLEVEHEANRQESAEEVAAVRAEVERLLAAGISDVIVVAAYNAQVNALREGLPENVRVGTVDKFQGQEADVVLYSMASSSGEDVPRGLEFLLSRNRLNVAISRARCLAYLVASPRLLEVNCKTIPQMRLANALCRFVELAT
jgi:hypothetical protein